MLLRHPNAAKGFKLLDKCPVVMKHHHSRGRVPGSPNPSSVPKAEFLLLLFELASDERWSGPSFELIVQEGLTLRITDPSLQAKA